MITLREYRPGFADSIEPLREAHISSMSEAVTVPWIRERTVAVAISGAYVCDAASGYIIAIAIK